MTIIEAEIEEVLFEHPETKAQTQKYVCRCKALDIDFEGSKYLESFESMRRIIQSSIDKDESSATIEIKGRYYTDRYEYPPKKGE